MNKAMDLGSSLRACTGGVTACNPIQATESARGSSAYEPAYQNHYNRSYRCGGNPVGSLIANAEINSEALQKKATDE